MGRGPMAKKIEVSELTQHIGYWMRFVSNHVSHAFMLKVEAQGVTVAEWAAMRQMFFGVTGNPEGCVSRSRGPQFRRAREVP